MNESWFVFFGHQLGMSRQETLSTRYGEMLDMISCLAIYNGGADEKQDHQRHITDYMEAIKVR